MIGIIRSARSWIGLDPEEIVASNAFSNVIVRAVDGASWRICPENLSCEMIVNSRAEYESLLGGEEFTSDYR